MDALRDAVVFLLGEYVEVAGAKYARYISQITSLDEGDPLRAILSEERDKIESKLAKARVFIDALKGEKA